MNRVRAGPIDDSFCADNFAHEKVLARFVLGGARKNTSTGLMRSIVCFVVEAARLMPSRSESIMTKVSVAMVSGFVARCRSENDDRPGETAVAITSTIPSASCSQTWNPLMVSMEPGSSNELKKERVKEGVCRRSGSVLLQNHSVIAEEGHSSMQAPQSMHLPASMTAMSSQVMAPSGQTSTHAPHATHSDPLIVTI